MTNCEKAIAKIIAAAWADSGFRDELLAAGADRKKVQDALKKKKLELPEISSAPNALIQFVANTPDTRYVVIPQKPDFMDEDMGLMVKLRQEAANCCGCGGAIPHTSVLEGVVKKLLE